MEGNREFEVSVQPLESGARVEVNRPGRPLEWTTYSSMSEAQTAAEIITERLSGDGEPVTFAYFCGLWFDRHVRVECSRRTQKEYYAYLERLIPHFGNTLLPEITLAAVQTALVTESRRMSVRNALLRMLRRILNRAKMWHFIEANPVNRVDEEDEFGDGHE
jgi:hypothetical protein